MKATMLATILIGSSVLAAPVLAQQSWRATYATCTANALHQFHRDRMQCAPSTRDQTQLRRCLERARQTHERTLAQCEQRRAQAERLEQSHRRR